MSLSPDPRTRWVSQGTTDNGAIAWCCERCGDRIELSAMIPPPGWGGCKCYGEQSVAAARAEASQPKVEPKAEPQPSDNLLPGWTCVKCRAFNGSAKEELKACRACGTPSPLLKPNELQCICGTPKPCELEVVKLTKYQTIGPLPGSYVIVRRARGPEGARYLADLVLGPPLSSAWLTEAEVQSMLAEGRRVILIEPFEPTA